MAPASVTVLLRNSVVIDVHSERNRANRLTVGFRSPRQLLPGILLRLRGHNIYLDRVGIMGGYGINHRTWFLGPPRRQNRTQRDLARSVRIVMNQKWDPNHVVGPAQGSFRREQLRQMLEIMGSPECAVISPWP